MNEISTINLTLGIVGSVTGILALTKAYIAVNLHNYA